MGPLHGIRIVEFAGLGPGPLAATLLTDLGATVLRIERRDESARLDAALLKFDIVRRGRSAISLDLKSPTELALALSLIERADALIEGFRPGVMERMGLGPDLCLKHNARLVYCRMTGWGQTGPLARTAGHDINYIALTGALDAIGRAGQPPTPPLNLLGDYGGGSLYLALGLVAALFEARNSGEGQVVDVAMVDGVTSLMTKPFGNWAMGLATGEPVGPRGTNLLDSGAYFYDVYACADGRWLAVGAIEAKFHAELLRLLEINPAALPNQWNRAGWPRARAVLTGRFLEKKQAQWCEIFAGSDACVTPVLTIAEAAHDQHLRARATIIDVEGVPQPGQVPRFSRTVAELPKAVRVVDADRSEVLRDWGVKDTV